MMVVCSTSRVKPKGSPFELLSFFISSHTAAGDFLPPWFFASPAWRMDRIGSMAKEHHRGLWGERLSGLHLLSPFSAFPFDLENRKPYVGRKKSSIL